MNMLNVALPKGRLGEKAYAMLERALMYDWCLCGGVYNLSRYGAEMMSQFLAAYRN